VDRHSLHTGESQTKQGNRKNGKPVELNYSGWMLIMELAAYLLQLNGKQGMTKPIPIVLLTSGCKHLWTFDGTSCKINEFVRKPSKASSV
jgi:hypothetical protein